MNSFDNLVICDAVNHYVSGVCSKKFHISWHRLSCPWTVPSLVIELCAERPRRGYTKTVGCSLLSLAVSAPSVGAKVAIIAAGSAGAVVFD